MQNFTESNLNKYSDFIETSVLESLNTFLTSESIDQVKKSACEISSIFGSSKDFKSAISDNEEERNATEEKLLKSFHSNLQLLVKKTWVEKTNNTIKDQILERIDSCCEKISAKKYNETYAKFSTVINDAIMLMFSDGAAEDFAEYALRIDPEFGTFWCFLQCLPQQTGWNTEKIRMAILLQMCFLANY